MRALVVAVLALIATPSFAAADTRTSDGAWHTSLKAAKAEAQRVKKPIFVYSLDTR